MPDWLVCDRELSKIVANHVWLDLHTDELLAVVNSDDTSDHLRHDHHVPQMSLDGFRLLTISSLALCLAKLLEKSDGCTLNATAELTTGTGAELLHEILVTHIEELVQIDATV